MRSVLRLLVVLAVALPVSACGTHAAPPPTVSPSPIAIASTPTPSKPVPSSAATAKASGGATITPAPSPGKVGTTRTAWGTILDAVPDTFPVFPDSAIADPLPGAVSGAWITNARVDEVATWYHDAVLAAAFASADLGSALEDGSRVLDVQGDLPECKVQVTVRPAGGSTMISVLYGAGCAAAGG